MTLPEGCDPKIELINIGDVTVVGLPGDPTLGKGERPLLATIDPLLKKGRRKFVLDLTELEYVDSTGTSEVVQLYATIRHQGGNVILCHPSNRLWDLLVLTKLLTVFTVAPTVDDAVAAFASNGHLEATCEATCPVCGQVGCVRFTVAEFFLYHACFACGASFRLTQPAGSFVEAKTPTNARVRSVLLPTYGDDYVCATLVGTVEISAPKRLDLFTAEVVEKAWHLVREPRHILIDVCPVGEFTAMGVAKLIELCANADDRNQVAFVTANEQGTKSPIKDQVALTGRAYDRRDEAIAAIARDTPVPIFVPVRRLA